MTGYTVKDIADLVGGVLHGEGGAPVRHAAIDSRAVSDGDVFAALPGEKVDGHDYISRALDAGASCCLALRAPEGESRPVITVPDVAEALRVLASAYRDTLSIPIVGVTGSVGKTTAKEMLAAVLSRRFNTQKTQANLNNDLGVPLTLLSIDGEHQAAVVELGVSHFGDMSRIAELARPDLAVFTVIGRAHLEFLGDRDGVLRAKAELLDYMPGDGVVFLNGDDDKLRGLQCAQRKVSYGQSESCDIRAEHIVSDVDGATFEAVCGDKRISLRINAFGGHLVYAALAAAAVGLELGLSEEEIAAGVADYAPVGRRSRQIKLENLTIIDDCYNANPDSVAAAIDSAAALGGRLVCILGDMLELGEDTAELHRATGELALRRGALLLTVGQLSASMGGEHFENKRELIAALPQLIRPGDRVLVKASHSMAFEEITEALQKLEL